MPAIGRQTVAIGRSTTHIEAECSCRFLAAGRQGRPLDMMGGLPRRGALPGVPVTMK